MQTLLTLLTIVDLPNLLALLIYSPFYICWPCLSTHRSVSAEVTDPRDLTETTYKTHIHGTQPQALRILTLPRQQRRVRIMAADSILSGQYVSLADEISHVFEVLFVLGHYCGRMCY
jgi:hypothetical protein